MLLIECKGEALLSGSKLEHVSSPNQSDSAGRPAGVGDRITCFSKSDAGELSAEVVSSAALLEPADYEIADLSIIHLSFFCVDAAKSDVQKRRLQALSPARCAASFHCF